MASLSLLIVAAGGGLGRAIIREALSRGASVSVLVRSAEKFNQEAAADVPQLAAVYEGSGADSDAVAKAATAAGAQV